MGGTGEKREKREGGKREEMVKRDRKRGAEGGKRGTKRMARRQEGTSQCPPSSSPVSPMFPPTYPYVPTVSLQAAVMDTDPRSEGLYGRDPPRPPCVPVSPRPRDKVFPGVPKGHGVPVSCPVPPSGGGNPRLEVVLRQIHSLKKGECEEPCVPVFPPCFFVPHVLLCSLMCLPCLPMSPSCPTRPSVHPTVSHSPSGHGAGAAEGTRPQ